MSTFIRLNITAEGQTEERFVKQTLAPYFGNFNISTDVRNVLTSKDKHKFFRGGLVNYQKAKKDIQTWLKADKGRNVYFTTMFDFYALPNDFPGFNDSENISDKYERVEFLEQEFYKDINDSRFIPYIQLHEFEALLFSDPETLSQEYFDYDKEIIELIDVANKFNNPELINDNFDTAPSKRIINLIPEFDKVNIGSALAGEIGMEKLKDTCKHFHDWISKLENLNSV